MPSTRRVVLFALLAGCAATPTVPEGERTILSNDAKTDGARLRVRLNESSPLVGLGVWCDAELGCDGVVTVELRSPDACTVLGDPRCGVTAMEPTSVDIATLVLRSATEGERRLPLRVETADGDFVGASISTAFVAAVDEEVDIELELAEGAPEVTLQVHASWEDARPASARELEDYLSGLEGVAWAEASTAYPGYYAYDLWVEQPIDHDDPGAGSFEQRVRLHHLDRGAPNVLYTSGYHQHEIEYLSEVTEALGANQLETEQRFFGTSIPPLTAASDWEHVRIRQAAADHHRLVELLRPFYQGAWVGTGHSKGGMTSVYHRRFHPEDIDVTVAYVAPISFAVNDPRYLPFLDAIGTDECRARIRGFQHALLARWDEYAPAVEADAVAAGATYEGAGSFGRALESAIEIFEWSFWQGLGVTECHQVYSAEEVEAATPEDLHQVVVGLFGYGLTDSGERAISTYDYQVRAELGSQSFATAHLDDVQRFEDYAPHPLPAGAPAPVHDPSAMEDVQRWVLEEAEDVVFVYGEHDPWTGGAFDTDGARGAYRVTVPAAHHGAAIRELEASDRERVLDTIELAVGARPAIAPSFRPSRAPLPPRLLQRM